MDLKRNYLPLLMMWLEMDGEVFFLACELYLAHTLVRKWLRLRMSSEENQKAIKPGPYLSFTLWFSKSVLLYCCQWLDVEWGLVLWLILMLQRIFLGGGIGCYLAFWRLQLFTLSLLIAVIFTKMIKQFFPKKSPRYKFCLFLLLIYLGNTLYN